MSMLDWVHAVATPACKNKYSSKPANGLSKPRQETNTEQSPACQLTRSWLGGSAMPCRIEPCSDQLTMPVVCNCYMPLSHRRCHDNTRRSLPSRVWQHGKGLLCCHNTACDLTACNKCRPGFWIQRKTLVIYCNPNKMYDLTAYTAMLFLLLCMSM